MSGALTVFSTHIWLKVSNSLWVGVIEPHLKGFFPFMVFFVYHHQATPHQSYAPFPHQCTFLIIANNWFLAFPDEGVKHYGLKAMVEMATGPWASAALWEAAVADSRTSVVIGGDSRPCFLPRSTQPARDVADYGTCISDTAFSSSNRKP